MARNKDQEIDEQDYSATEEPDEKDRRAPHTKKDEYDTIYYMPIGLALGTAFGDMIFGNMVTGMLIGLVVGALLGGVFRFIKKKSKHK